MCKLPHGALNGNWRLDKDWKASTISLRAVQKGLRSLAPSRRSLWLRLNGATPPCQARRNTAACGVTALQALSRPRKKLHAWPQLFLLCIRAYSYVKREALKTCYALGGHLLCSGNVRGGLRLNNEFHFTKGRQENASEIPRN